MKVSQREKDQEITLGQKLKGHFIIARPLQLVWLDIFGALAIYAILAQHVPKLHFGLFILCSVIADAGACTINDLGDLGSDRLSYEPSRKLRPLVTGLVSKKAARNQAIILYSIGLAIAFYLDLYVFLAAFLLVLISYQYSMKPLKMDGRPVISQLFWVGFGFLYFFAIVAYLRRYENIPLSNIYNGLYFMMTMILFAAVAETLAKDLRDLENDRASGKNTTPSHYGHKPAAIGAFVFSLSGMVFWAIPYFTAYETHIILQSLVILIVILWNILCFRLCMSIYKNYSKGKARKLHIGFILTLTCIFTLTFLGGIT